MSEQEDLAKRCELVAAQREQSQRRYELDQWKQLVTDFKQCLERYGAVRQVLYPRKELPTASVDWCGLETFPLRIFKGLAEDMDGFTKFLNLANGMNNPQVLRAGHAALENIQSKLTGLEKFTL